MGNFYMEATQINYRRDDKPKTVDQKLKEISETFAIDTDIAPVFKSTNTYHPGDMVYYSNKLYVFNVEHTGPWAAADVTATDVTTEISSLKSGLTNLFTNIQTAKSFQGDSEVKYAVLGKVVVFYANITKNQASWTIAYGLPKPYFSEAVVGYLEDNFAPSVSVFIYKDTSDGRLQVRSSNTSITNKRLYGVYLTE